ncbi:MAG: DegT/DnrJ/EryC1/StrS family aminotransferase [Acidobacteriota bacterium]|nr:MAG: DegT/DnrJ/EryC1/StrS family aminotransferase [Acidobacteriota bacterium]
MMPLPRYRLYTSARRYAAVARDVAAGRRLAGTACGELERTLEQQVGVAHAICAPRARVGIYLAVRALVPPGRKVVLSPYTISDVVNMVIAAGAVPVFADVQRETCNIDPSEVERLVDDDTGAVLVTHLHGLACEMDRLVAICRERGVRLIEDAAQSFGARFDGRPLASFGDAGIFSFGLYKNVTSIFGGMVVTPHDDVAERVRTELDGFAHFGLSPYLRETLGGVATDIATWPPLFRAFTYRIFRFGFLHDIGLLNNQVTVEANPQLRREIPSTYLRRMTPMQSRLVLDQLAHVDDNIRARIAFAKRYHDGLRDLPEVLLPPLRDDFSHMYTYFPIQVEDRQALLRHLQQHHLDVAAQHLKNCADLECFADWARDCPRARATADSVVLLPTYPRYSLADVDDNVRLVRDFLGRG